MMSDLCWKCREEYKERMLGDPASYYHCHHEPKEKVECWCRQVRPMGEFDQVRSTLLSYNIGLQYCPQCGRELKRIK